MFESSEARDRDEAPRSGALEAAPARPFSAPTSTTEGNTTTMTSSSISHTSNDGGETLRTDHGVKALLFRAKRKTLMLGIASCLLGLYYVLSLQDITGPSSFSSHSITDKGVSPMSAIWDVDSPPVQLTDNQTIESLLEQIEQLAGSTRERLVGPSHGMHVAQDKRIASVAADSHADIQHYKDDKVPGASSTTLHAADSLLCRKSVVNFVINATDAKDECDGLKKAFDKTCSNDNSGGEGHRTLKRQRSYADKLQYANRARLLLYRTTRYYNRFANYLFGRRALFFFAEDEVANGYDDAVCLVEQNIDDLFRRDVQKQWRRRQLEDATDEATDEAELPAPDSTTNTSTAIKPLPSLDIPTANQHISEKVAGEMLMIHQGEENIEKAMNQSLSKQATEARDDAAKSSKAVSDSSAAVNALLNDPTSIEARTCCASILNVYHENCSKDEEEDISDGRLFFVVFVMALCGMIKSLIRHFRILWLPEAAGCIIVGVISGYIILYIPHHDLSFDGNWFLRILVPPIIFEAALSIDKRSFNRHLVPILLYAVVGTLMSTALTAYVVHMGTTLLSRVCTPIPYVEALTFGALISSIDPIAVLSVLSNMGMSDTDTIYVLIFGESLLNDGVAIVLFNTLVHFMDETLIIDRESIEAAAVHFVIVAFGSLLVGIASGYLATAYYWVFYGCQTPVIEVLMFCCWALLPYYVCDGIGWSGIVSAVAVGFVMDINIIGQKQATPMSDESDDHGNGVSKTNGNSKVGRPPIFSPEGLLSQEARQHIGFVTEIISTTMETAIFAYLGLFLFSHRYHWNFFHTLIAIIACCVSRGVMIPTLSHCANFIIRIQHSRVGCISQGMPKGSQQAGVIVDKRMQVVLWFAGLRGAMSFALVEHVPLFDTVTGEGTRLKPELKAMTSACIMFTVFILGGYTYYMMEALGVSPSQRRRSDVEMAPLIAVMGKAADSGDEYFVDSPDQTRSQHNARRAFRRKPASRETSGIDVEMDHQ